MSKGNRYSKEDKDRLVIEISDNIAIGSSICKACKHIQVSRSTYMKWLTESDDYARTHARAMEGRADFIFDEILTIADNIGEDIIIDSDGNEIVNHNVIQRDRLRVDARKWVAAKMNPNKYGNKVDVTSGGEKLQTQFLSIDPLSD
jgi:transposase-like protein